VSQGGVYRSYIRECDLGVSSGRKLNNILPSILPINPFTEPSTTSEERISKFVAGFALSDASNQLLREQFLDRHQMRATKIKTIDADSLKIKSFFMDKIGRDWATASRRN